MNENFTRELNGTTLAYIGDAALELMVRKYLIGLCIMGSGKLNALALKFVRATAQSAAVGRLLPYLTEDEEYMFRRGRNAHGISIPKSASALEYRRATGMEALFGYLCLAGKTDRANELFALAYADVMDELEPGKTSASDIPKEEFDRMLEIANTALNQADNLTTTGTANELRAVVAMSEKGDLYNILASDFTEEDVLLQKMTENSDTAISKILCVFKGGGLEIPSYHLRKALCELNEKNMDTEILLRGADGTNIRKISASF